MSFILWIVIGGVVGWLASIIMKTNAQMGLVANVIVGCVGALLGGWLAGLLGISASGIGTFVVSIIGAAILIALLRALGLFK